MFSGFFSNVKAYIYIGIAVLMGLLYSMFRIQKSEKETALEQVAKYKSSAQENKNVIEVQSEIKKATDKIDSASRDDISGMLSKYDRSRKD